MFIYTEAKQKVCNCVYLLITKCYMFYKEISSLISVKSLIDLSSVQLLYLCQKTTQISCHFYAYRALPSKYIKQVCKGSIVHVCFHVLLMQITKNH